MKGSWRGGAGSASATALAARATELVQSLQGDHIPTSGDIPCIEKLSQQTAECTHSEIELQKLEEGLTIQKTPNRASARRDPLLCLPSFRPSFFSTAHSPCIQ